MVNVSSAVRPLLSSVTVFLRAERTQALPESLGRALHAQFLDLIRRVNPKLSESLHYSNSLKPFAVFPLVVKSGRGDEGETFVKEGTGARWRVGCLNEEVASAFLEGVAGAQLEGGYRIALGGVPFEIRRIATTAHESARWAATSTPAQLLANASTHREMTAEFLSPTSFRKNGRQFLFPIPELSFGSWLRRWEVAGGAMPDSDFMARVVEYVFVARYRLSSRITPFEDYKIVGFSGEITYEAGKRMSTEDVKFLNALVDFAFFAGTGYKTTMGLGETRRAA